MRIVRAVCALYGHAAVGLGVNGANPARRLSERLGFRDAFSRVRLTLRAPGRTSPVPA